jgi:hypothetical protein
VFHDLTVLEISHKSIKERQCFVVPSRWMASGRSQNLSPMVDSYIVSPRRVRHFEPNMGLAQTIRNALE